MLKFCEFLEVSTIIFIVINTNFRGMQVSEIKFVKKIMPW